jgi:hypothetical protein
MHTNRQVLFFIIKPTRCTNFPNLLRHETLYVSSSSSAQHQEFIHITPGTGICHTSVKKAFEQDQHFPSWSCSKAVFRPVWLIPVPSVQWINSWWWAEELSETCRVSWRSKFGKLVHLVCFIIKKFVTMHGHMNVKFDKGLLKAKTCKCWCQNISFVWRIYLIVYHTLTQQGLTSEDSKIMFRDHERISDS